eukprot:TRINITY_DN14872_c0_g1_i1.p1 TRINITY_DN14872_c0_g1~~TRINITY_DN14872_c0_g1_i1.p1  ORF type:complete len:1329 (+),score=259.85 TRINITY_DN14872_c0_g1_i1:94-3987(+)
MKGAVIILLAAAVLRVECTAPDPHVVVDDSGSGGNDTNNTCGECLVAMCPLEMYSWTKLTWYDHNCEYYTDPHTILCIDYIAKIEGSGKPHEEEHNVPYVIITIFSSFALGAIIRHFFKDSPVPYTVVLFIVGLGWGALSKATWTLEASVAIYSINPHLIFHIFLPVLIFESAFAMEIPVFKKVVGHCLLLAVPGLMLASTLTAVMAKYMFVSYDWNWYACLLFGTILSATDPVAVVALLKELGASPVISTMIEGESLFNDGTAIVFFHVLVEAIQTNSCPPDWDTCTDQCFCALECTLDKSYGAIVLQLFKVAVGGAAVGIGIGMASVALLNRVFNDAMVEITMTFVAAYVTFFVCEVFFELSGVLGVVTCGCFMSYYRHCISPEVTHTLHEFWEVVVYLTNTLIFILAGLIAYIQAFNGITGTDVGYLCITYLGINFIRFFCLLVFWPVMRLFKYKVDWANLCLVTWGGLRGAVGLALALIIQADEKVAVPFVREKFVFHVAGICILTLCVNGVTTQYVVQYFSLNAIEERKKCRMHDVWNNLLKEQNEDLRELRSNPILYDTNWEQVGKYSDLRRMIGTKMEDPYNKNGWFEKKDMTCSDEEVCKKQRVEGKAVYLSSMSASLVNQYKLGTLRRQGIRHMTKEIVRSTEMPMDLERPWTDTLIQAEWIKELFNPSRVEETIAVNQGMREWLLKWRWQNAFDVSLAVIRAQDETCKRIKAICNRDVSNAVDTHCKRAKREIIKALTEAAEDRPDISTSLKTRSACRNILNTMEHNIKKMRKEARLDDQDANALLAILKKRMKMVTQKLSRSMPPAEASEVLETLSWYKAGSRATQQTLYRCSTKVVMVPENVRLEGPEFNGLIVVVVGIIQLRVGRKIFKYGSGYTAGWNRILTGHDRFSEVTTESACSLLLIPAHVVQGLMEDSMFNNEAWKCCGINTARCLMSLDDVFDPKIWDDRKIRKAAESGHVVILQDPAAYDIKNERRHILRQGFYRCLLRGKAWEYGEERDHIGGSLCRFPTMIPAEFRFANFTGHAVMFEMEAATSASIRARKRWGVLKSWMKSVVLWSKLRGPKWGRCCLALAYKATPLEEPPEDEAIPISETHSMSDKGTVEIKSSHEDEIVLGSSSSDTPNVHPLLPKPTTGIVQSEYTSSAFDPGLFSPLSAGISSNTPAPSFIPPTYPSQPVLKSASVASVGVPPSVLPVPPPSQPRSAKSQKSLVLPPPPDFRTILDEIEKDGRASPAMSSKSKPPSFSKMMTDLAKQVNDGKQGERQDSTALSAASPTSTQMSVRRMSL